MKHILFSAVIASALFGCNTNKTPEPANIPLGVHRAVVEEVLQTSQYTYLHVKEGEKESWLAVAKLQASPGETYYFKDALPMVDFESKELKKTFKEISFLDEISSSPTFSAKAATTAPDAPTGQADKADASNTPASTPAFVANHAVKAEEVLQTKQYTYIRAKEGNEELWLAVARMEATAGTSYYFKGGLPMTDFESKELKRRFKQILFVDNISTSAPAAEGAPEIATQNNQLKSSGSSIPTERLAIQQKHEKGELTIASLLENKKSYSGKKIKIKGKVTKFNAGIMKKNWIHLQDGTEFSGKFDLTITTDQIVKVGDNITVEGTISTDKDFGFGYFYEVLLEDAKQVD